MTPAMLRFINPNDSPHDAPDQNDRFRLAHMDFLFKNNQDIGEEKTDQGELTRPSIDKVFHKVGA
jgi:hypothetical protein